MKSVKRILALWLVMALLLGMLPAGAEQIAPTEAQIAVEAVPDDGTELGSEEPEVLEQEPLGASDESAGAVPEEEAIPENPGFLMDGDTLVVYEGAGGDVIVPEGVKVIGPVAFCQLPELRSVELPESVERIGSYAFADCENLEEVALPEGLKAIGDHAFQNCPKLKGLALPEGLESIGDEAFQGCDALGEVAIPAGAEVAEETALPEQVVAEPEADIPSVEGVDLDAEAVEGQPAALEDEGGFRIVNPVEAIGVKENYTLKASLEDEGNVWTSDNEKYVKVVNSATGEIRGAKKGKATITVTAADGQTASTVVQVLSAPSKVSLSAKKGTLGVNETVQLTAKLPKKTASQSITWTSNHPEIAKVEGGLVTAVSAGKAKITAQTFNKKKASYTVTVKAEPERIDVREALTLSKGQRYALNISLTPSTAAGKVKITNTNQSALKLDKTEFTVSGKASIKLTALAEGSATLRLELYNGLSAECEVKVCAVPTTLKIVNAVSSLGVKEEYQLRAESNADASLMMHAKWKSSNKKIIAVDSATGKLTAKKKGTATISVTLPKGKKTIKKSAKIKVVGAASGIALNQTSAELKPGDTLQLTATVPKKTASQIHWSSDDEGVATVENGLVTAINGGEATITASTFNGHSASCAVTVKGAGAPVILINGVTAGKAVCEVFDSVELTWWSAVAADSYDVCVEDESGASVLALSAITETSATIPESSLNSGETYTVRITATRDGETSKTTVARFRYIRPEPLVIESIQVDKESAQTGDPVVWTANVSGGARPLTYAWEVRCGEELEYSGTSIGPELSFAPRSSGSYVAKLTATDTRGESVEAMSAPLTVTERSVAPTQEFTFKVLDDTYCEITGYKGNDTVLILPETDGEGHIVQQIRRWLFGSNKALHSVVIPDSVEFISEGAFGGCTGLTQVSLPEGMLKIEDYAFDNCTSLEQIHIPDSVTTLGQYVFRGCTKLREVNYPKGLKEVNGEHSPFLDCPQLTHMVVPEGVATIPSYAFGFMTSLENIKLPEGLETIRENAFNGCASLEQIHIPDSVTTLEHDAFYNCTKLREVNYPKGWNVGYTPFSKCPRLTHMVVPEGVTAIPPSAFYNTSLESIELPETLETIGKSAFGYCTGLGSIRLPENLVTIERNAFWECSKLASVIVPSKVTEIGDAAFSGCMGLTQVSLLGRVETIQEFTFRGCTGLTRVSLPEGLETIGHAAFGGCAGLTQISLPEGLLKIENNAFAACRSLERIHIPDSVTTLGYWAFRECEKLREVNYPKGWKEVVDGFSSPFGDCPQLTHIMVPEGVTAIPDYAFRGATGLESVELPESLETIGNAAFYECSALRSVRIGANVNSIVSNAFSGCDPAKLTFYGVAGSYAETWAELYGYNFSTEEIPTERVKLTGRVITRDGQPIPGVTVTLWEDASTDGTPIVVTTNENGDWSYDGAKAWHEYFITYSKPDYELSIYKLTLTVGSTDTSAGIVYGASRFVSTVMFSGRILTDAGAAIANALVKITDASSGNTLAMATSSEQGAWSANVPRTDEVRITYQAEGYAFPTNGILLPATGDQSVADAIATVVEALPAVPRIVSVKLPAGTIETCTDVRMQVQTSDAMSVILVVDGVRYETYPVIDDVATVIRAFSVGGERKIQFIPVSPEGEGEISAAQTLQIRASGTLPQATITAQSKIYVGEAFKISWNIAHADACKLRVYRGDEVIWISEWISEQQCEIPGSIFNVPGEYSVLLSAEGRGYSQSDTSWPLTVSTRTVSIALKSPKNNGAFVPGDIVYLTADNPNGEFVAFRITRDEDVFYLPATGTVNIAEPLDCLTVEEPGDYRIEVVAYADAQRRGEIGSSAPVTIHVNGGTIYSCNVGSGQGTMLTSDITSLWCKTNNAVSEVNVYLDDKSFTTLSDYTEDASFTRTFKMNIASPGQGFHKYKFEAVGSDETRAARSFAFYAMDPYADTTKLFYPADDNVELIGPYPVSPSTGYRLNKYTGVTIHGVYGDQYYVKTSGRLGFVGKNQLVDRIDTATLVRTLHLALDKLDSEDSDHQYVPLSSHLVLDWYCDVEIGEDMYYEVYFVNPNDLTEEHVLYTGTETSMSAAISDVPEGTYYIEVRLWLKEGDKTYQVAHADTSGYGNEKRMYIVYNDLNGKIIRSDNDSSKILVRNAQNLAQNYAQMMAKTKADYQEYIENPAFQSWSWLFGDALDATQANTLKGVYLADRIMYSLSSNKKHNVDISLNEMIDFFDFLDDWTEAVDGINDQVIVDWFKNAVGVVYKQDGVYFISTDPKDINDAMKKMQEDFHVNGDWIEVTADGFKLADLLFSALQDYAVYTCVSPTDLKNAVDSLYKGKDDSQIISVAWEVLGSYIQNGKLNKSNIRTMLCVGYLGEFASDKIADALRDIACKAVEALAEALGMGPLMAGCKAGAAIAEPVVDFALNIEGIQEKAYRVLWAMEAADEYSPVYLKAVREFERAPLTNYGEMVKASATFCFLISNVVQALYDHWDEVHSAPWQCICDFCSGYNVDAEKENHKRIVQLYKNFLKGNCEDFYVNFVQPNKMQRVEWSN